MNQIINELADDPTRLKEVITDLCDITGQMSLALLARLLRSQQEAIDKQEIEIAALKRQIKTLAKSVEANEIAIVREGEKRTLALNVSDDRHERLVQRLKVKFDENKKETVDTRE